MLTEICLFHGEASTRERRLSANLTIQRHFTGRWDFAGQAYRVSTWHYCISKRTRTLQRSRVYRELPVWARSPDRSCDLVAPSARRLFASRSPPREPSRVKPRGQTSRVQVAGVWCRSLRGAVVRLVRGGRWGLTARGRVGVERARENPWWGLAAAKQQCVAILAATRLPINLFSLSDLSSPVIISD